MPSAAFTFTGKASLEKVELGTGGTITATLDSTDGVSSILWRIASTDGDQTELEDWVLSATNTASVTVTAPVIDDSACLLECVVNGGTGIDPATGRRSVGDLVKRAKIYIGIEVGCTDETFESDAVAGYGAWLNPAVRIAGSGGLSVDDRAIIDSILYSSGNLTTDLTVIGSTERTLRVSGTTTLGASSVTIPANVRIDGLDAARLSIGSGQTLTFNCPVTAPRRQIFTYADETANVVFNFQGRQEVYPEWWGAKGDNSTNDGTAFSRMFRVQSLLTEQLVISIGPGRKYRLGSTELVLAQSGGHCSYQIEGNGATIYGHPTTGGAILRFGDEATDKSCSQVYVERLNVYRTPGQPKTTGTACIRIEQANDGWLREIHCGGYDRTIDVTGSGGNHWLFDHVFVGDGRVFIGPNATVNNTNVWTWRGGKFDLPDLGWMRSSTSTLPTDVDFDGTAHTITRNLGSWISDGFSVGQTVYVSGSASNNGLVGTITALTSTVMTFASGITTESNVDGKTLIMTSWAPGAMLQVKDCVGFSISGVDFSNNPYGAIKLENCSEFAIRQLYTENISAQTTTNTESVIEIVNCSHGHIDGRINGTGPTTNDNKSSKWGIKISGPSTRHIDIDKSYFTIHQGADVRIESDVLYADTIRIDTAGEDVTSPDLGYVRVSNASLLQTANVGRTRRFPRTDAKRRDNLIVSPDNFAHPSWTLENSAALNGTTTSHDGTRTVQVVSLPTSGADFAASSKISATLFGSMGAIDCRTNLENKYARLRFWCKCTAVTSAGTVHAPRLLVSIARTSNDRGTFRAYLVETNSEWQYIDVCYALPAHVAGWPINTLYGLTIGNAHGDFSGFDVALSPPDLAIVSSPLENPPYVAFADQQPGPTVSESAAAYGGRIRQLRKQILYSDPLVDVASTTAAVPLGLAPAGSRVLGCTIPLATPYAGITGPVTVDIGSSGDADALIDDADLQTAAVDGMASSAPNGIAPRKVFAAATLLNATVKSASGNLGGLTAGDASPEVLLWVPNSTLVEPVELGGCTAWLRHDVTSRTIASNLVSNWADSAVGSSNDFAQATGTNQPMTGATINGRSSVMFDGVDNYLVGPNLNTLITNAQSFSIYALLSIEEMATGSAFSLSDNTYTTNDGILFDASNFFGVSANTTQLGVGWYNGSNTRTRVFADYPKGLFVLAFRYDGTDAKLEMAGVETSQAQAAGPASITNATRIGRNGGGGGTAYGRFTLVELAMFDHALSSTDHATMKTRLSTLGGLS